MAGNNGPKIVTNGLIRYIDASQYGGWGRPETYDASNLTSYFAVNLKNFSGIGEPYYYNPESFHPSLWTLNGIRCFSTMTGDPRTFSGAFAYIKGNPVYNLGITGNANRTYEIWFYLTSSAAHNDDYGTSVSNFTFFVNLNGYSGWTLVGFGLYSDTQLLIHGWGANIFYLRSSSFSSILNRWVLAGMTNNGNNINFYLNGESVGTGTVSLNTYDGQVGLMYRGYQYTHPYGFWSGAKIYNRQLSAAEMKQNFDAQRGKYKV